ncbi:TspO/MBR related protein [Lachnotalea glycerini]|uniref:TspO/MBR related protein n=2 Tax=Lachnotalea glycerini TaxID=1763509 RepID=A0A318F2R1_9FIRM|nr:TspO/MBR family protein [Lachnotalea glycerini]PXV96158.1 TspO/MBR related protein [Lachnotalea glycerini]
MYIKWKELLFSIAVSVGIGALASQLTKESISVYNSFTKPLLSPPVWLFSIVWTILYILMGVSAYMIYSAEASQKEKGDALRVYGIQLFLNFIWSLIFFNLHAYLIAFMILLLLWFAVYIMIERFSAIYICAGKLQIPYLLWIMFSGYLNLGIIFLNGSAI